MFGQSNVNFFLCLVKTIVRRWEMRTVSGLWVPPESPSHQTSHNQTYTIYFIKKKSLHLTKQGSLIRVTHKCADHDQVYEHGAVYQTVVVALEMPQKCGIESAAARITNPMGVFSPATLSRSRLPSSLHYSTANSDTQKN